MKQIYTKTGDGGQTSLRGGLRVDKDDPRIEANGQTDHLNSLLGLVRASLPPQSPHRTLIADVQRELMTVMSHVATPDGEENTRRLQADELTRRMEQAIDEAAAPTGFVIPGDTPLSALVHVARTQARTVERRLWTLHRTHPVDERVLQMMNRLSDYLFVVAQATGKEAQP